MARMDNMLRYFAIWLNGRDYLGEGIELKMPDLKIKTDDVRGGGMDAPIEVDLGMDKLSAEWKVTSYDEALFSQWGLRRSQVSRLTFRGHLEGQNPQGSNGQANIARVMAVMDARIMELNKETWAPGKHAVINVRAAVDYFKLIFNDRPVIEIDVLGFKRSIGGIDQLADARVSLGITNSTG
ncbi:phage major tail tube protein [Hyphomicrobium sp.]|uniref:phage major tail tube protein n=1 Tax=Hyphomicrobium sp. TaxID=82 RepID=UPI001DFA4309|nr:phage major tail tube protein [Hyphomicrobium sp.]MBY0559875.1 phage major tail tube protein [Hyphomicrobium sp.]